MSRRGGGGASSRVEPGLADGLLVAASLSVNANLTVITTDTDPAGGVKKPTPSVASSVLGLQPKKPMEAAAAKGPSTPAARASEVGATSVVTYACGSEGVAS